MDFSIEARRAAMRRVVDDLLDAADRAEERRAALSDDERAAEDRGRDAREEQERLRRLETHQARVNVRVDVPEDGLLRMTEACWDRQRLRDQGYVLDVPESGRAWFEADDRRWYPFETYRTYDETGALPETGSAPHPIAEWFARELVDRAFVRGVGPFRKPDASPAQAETTPSWEEQVEAKLQWLLDNHEQNERQRTSLTPEERAAEEREVREQIELLEAEAERERRTTILVRREGEAQSKRLSRDEVIAKGFQPLFALRHAQEDVYFEAEDGSWYRIEAYPEYARTGAIPSAEFAAPHGDRQDTPLHEAVLRFQEILRERSARS